MVPLSLGKAHILQGLIRGFTYRQPATHLKVIGRCRCEAVVAYLYLYLYLSMHLSFLSIYIHIYPRRLSQTLWRMQQGMELLSSVSRELGC